MERARPFSRDTCRPMAEPVKSIILIFVSSSLPRFSGDYSGSFIPPVARRLRAFLSAHRGRPVHLLYLSPDDPRVVRPRGLGRRLYFRPRPAALKSLIYLGHGRGKALLSPTGAGRLRKFKILGALGLVPLRLFLYGLAQYQALKRLMARFTPVGDAPGKPNQRQIVLWYHFAFPTLLAPSRDGSVKQLATFHSSDVRLWRFWGLRFLARLFFRRATRRLDSLQLVSEPLNQLFDRDPALAGSLPPGLPRHILPMLPDIEVKPPVKRSTPPSPGPTRLLFLAGFIRVKGILDLLLELVRPGPPGTGGPKRNSPGSREGDWSLTARGEGNLLPAARAIVEDNRWLPVEILSGRVPKEEVPDYIGRFDYLLLPSVRDGAFEEGLPVTALEALARGVPVITTEACPPLADLVRRYGAGYVFANIREMAAGLPKLPGADQPEHAARVAGAARLWRDGQIREKEFFAALSDILPEETKFSGFSRD